MTLRARLVDLYDRLKAFPFEVAFAGLAFVAGVAGVLHVGTSTDALNTLLPSVLVTSLNFVYAVSGLTLLLGLGLPRRDIEGFGLVQLFAAIATRGVAVAAVAGLNPDTVALFVLYGLILWACFVRLRTLFVAREVAVDGGP